MRKKLTSKVYMRGVVDWNMLVSKSEDENFYTLIKKINKIEQPFAIKDRVLIDNGYYIIEFTPLDQFYNVRVFLNKNAKVIGYYFDISRGNGIENNIPYYDDLYLDIIYSPDNNTIRVEDEDELLDALNNKTISVKEYNLANETCSKLIEEIKANKNKFINIDKSIIINKISK